jgi:hypothetical protein
MAVQSNKALWEGSCHCGAVRLVVAQPPTHVIKCNCSICTRLGALWAHYTFAMVNVEGHPQNTSAYVWGNETLKTIRCRTCGCATHWEALKPQAGAEVGVNMNNFDQQLLQNTPVRTFDGADTWTYLD